MKTKVHTVTKTAAGWMIAGGAVALAASFLLGNPFLPQKDTNQQPVITNPTGLPVGDVSTGIENKKAAQCKKKTTPCGPTTVGSCKGACSNDACKTFDGKDGQCHGGTPTDIKPKTEYDSSCSCF